MEGALMPFQLPSTWSRSIQSDGSMVKIELPTWQCNLCTKHYLSKGEAEIHERLSHKVGAQ